MGVRHTGCCCCPRRERSETGARTPVGDKASGLPGEVEACFWEALLKPQRSWGMSVRRGCVRVRVCVQGVGDASSLSLGQSSEEGEGKEGALW